MGMLADIGNLFASKSQNSDSSDLAPIKEIQDQDPDEVKLVEFVKNKIDQIRQTNSRITLEQIYMTNVAYLLGFDGVYYDSNYRQFKNNDPKRRLTRARFRVNKILPTCQNRLARLCQSPPRFDVRPNSNSSEDKDGARLALELVRDVFDKQRLDEKRQDLLMKSMQGGISYLQVSWDPTLGEPMIDPDTQEFLGYDGDVRIETLNCLEVFPDPLATSIESMGYWIKAKVRKLDYFREQYPERGRAVKEESTWLLSSIYDLKANALTSVGISGAATNDQMKNSAIELVYYEKRSKDYPRGRMVVIANGVLLEDKELPVGEFDLVKFDDITVGGRFNSEAVITHLRPIQDQYNITRTKCADWVRKMLAGKYLAAKGHEMSQEAIDNDSGEVVEYTAVPNAAPPQPMNIPVIPAYVYKDLDTLDKEFDFISGINEISRGVLPSASIPASGMAFLQEQDQTRIGVQTKRNEIGHAKVGQLVLKYIHGFVKTSRIYKMAGDGLEYAVKEYVGSDIKENYDCIVVPDSTIPQSKVLRRQDILNDFELGLLGNPQDMKVRQRVNKMLEYGDEAEIWKKQALTEARCKKVIASIEENDQETVSSLLSEFDNHTIHLDLMDDYRLSDKFEQLSDEQKLLFQWVMEWRLTALVNITQPQIGQTIAQGEIANQVMQKNMAKGRGPTGGMNVVHQMASGMEPVTQSDIAGTLTNIKPLIDAAGNILAPPPTQAPVPNQTPPIK
jgi:hypothetical protein